MTPRIAALLVTHNSVDFLDETLVTIDGQDVPAGLRLAIDDHSTDGTRDVLREHGFEIRRATSPALDTTTRIAHNFLQGLRGARDCGAEIVILGDHDDVWHSSRIAHQSHVLDDNPEAAMVASNGFLIDEHGVALPGTLRGTFPVPTEFSSWPTRHQWTFALGHSLATGGASALRPASLSDWSIPYGWLHDRWWSLRSLRERALIIDPTVVIDYRVSRAQRVGLDTGNQHSRSSWLLSKARNSTRTVSRGRDLGRLL